MQRIELNISELRAEIDIWQDSAKDAFTEYSNESDKKKKNQHWADYQEFTAIVTLLTDMKQDPSVMIAEGVSNQEISDTMWELLEEIEEDVECVKKSLRRDICELGEI